MDLSLSPDWDARLCYAIVFVCGALSAWGQVRKRFLALKITSPLVWLVPNTWLLFSIYLLMPLGLFWFMDRMHGLSDTSLFSALLVGLGYPAVLAGGIGGLKAPAGLEGIFKPISALADTVQTAVNNKLGRKERRFQELLVNRMLEDPSIYGELLQLLKSSEVETTGLAAKLEKVDAATTADRRLQEVRKAQAIYPRLLTLPDFDDLLSKNKQWLGYWWRTPVNKARMVWGAAVLVLLCVLVGGVLVLRQPGMTLRYHVWRLSKPNNSAQDRVRACGWLGTSLQDPHRGEAAYQAITDAMRSPGLPAERVDLFLQLVLQARAQPWHDQLLCRHLIDTLLVENVDARARIQQALIFLAEQRDTPQAKFMEKEVALAKWNPTKGDSVPDLARRVDQWRKFFDCDRAAPAP